MGCVFTPYEAGELMKAFHDTETVRRKFAFFNEIHREALLRMPFDREQIESCAKTHLLYPDIGLSVADICKLHPRLFHDSTWFKNEPFATYKPEKAQWRLLRLDYVERPDPRVLVYAAALHFLVTGDWLFEREHIATDYVDRNGLRVLLRFTHERGIFIEMINEKVLLENEYPSPTFQNPV